MPYVTCRSMPSWCKTTCQMRMPEGMSEHALDFTAGHMSEDMPATTSEHIPKHVPAFAPDDASEHIPDLMQEQSVRALHQSMPSPGSECQDSVSVCQYMCPASSKSLLKVGIARSKVIGVQTPFCVWS